eukprot:1571093-Amphidinium_carterae.1
MGTLLLALSIHLIACTNLNGLVEALDAVNCCLQMHATHGTRHSEIQASTPSHSIYTAYVEIEHVGNAFGGMFGDVLGA